MSSKRLFPRRARIVALLAFALICSLLSIGPINPTVSVQAAVAGPVVFINEIHYDDTDPNHPNDFVEVAGPAGTNLSGYRVQRYHTGGAADNSVPLTGLVAGDVIPDQGNGFGTVAVSLTLFDGPHGIALVYGSTAIQFLSYEGTITGTSGPANGMTSEDIGVTESNSTPITHSLQLQGTGDDYNDFTWAGPIANTRGAINTGQTFQALTDDHSALVVTKNADTNDFVCDSDCSLREAITVANSDPGAETITFAPSVVSPINLSSPLPPISGATTITGPGASQLTVQRDPSATVNLRIFEVRSGANLVTISDLTLSGGAVSGEGVFGSNPIGPFSGAGINNSGTLTLTDVTISGNTASNGAHGGGIYNSGTLTLTDVTISGNAATGNSGNASAQFNNFSSGGGIYNSSAGTLTATDSFITGNNTTFTGSGGGGSGGGIYNLGGLTLTNVTVSNNTSPTGGGIYHNAAGANVATITGSTLDNNTVSVQPGGGGIYIQAGTVNITSSTISNNDALNNDPGSLGSGPSGAGILNDGTLTLLNSTVSGNTADGYGGGIYNSATFTATNSTISANYSGEGGGGIFNGFGASSVTTLTNVTIANNSTSYVGGGIFTYDTVNFGNTIIANNTADEDGNDISDEFGSGGVFNSQSHNLVEDTSGATITGDSTGNITGQDPELDALSNYGGPTQTHKLQLDSPALDAGDDSAVTNPPFTGPPFTDQRGPGFPRIVDGPDGDTTATVDIGAYELGALNQPPVNSVPGAQNVNEDTTLTFNAANSNPISISDPDAASGLMQVTLTVTNGTLTLNGTTGLTFSTGDGTADATMTFTGTITNINNALDGLSFTPTTNYNGPATLTITTNDQGNTGEGGAQSDTDNVAITVTSVDDPIDAVNDSYTTFQNTPLNIAAPGVLSNDTDADNAVTATPIANGPTTAGGTVTLNSDGSFSYTPPSGYNGADSFTYTANGGSASDTATVNITVNPLAAIFINEVLFNPAGTDAPNEYIELRGPVGAVIPAGTYFIGIEGDNADNPGDVQTIINLSGLTFGSNGFLVLLQNGNTYTTAAGATVITSTTTGFSGLPGGIFSADAGTDIEDDSVTLMLIQTVTAPALTDDIDTDNNATPDGSAFAGWSVRDSIGVLNTTANGRGYGAINYHNGASGTSTPGSTVVTVTFTAGYVGRIGDSTGSTAADWVASIPAGTAPNFTLGTAAQTEPASFAGKPLNHIGASNFVNLPPANTVPDSDAGTAGNQQTTNEDTALVFSSANSNPITVSDPDAGTAPLQVTITVTNGTFSLGGTVPGSLTVTGNGTSTVTITGPQADINTALNGSAYTPTAHFSGSASLQIVTNDQGNTGAGGAKSDTDTIQITVGAVNDAPVATNDSYATAENTQLNVSAPGVLTNDTDVDNTSLTAVVVSNPSNGTLTLNTDGSFTYMPNAGFNGADSFTYKASDGAADSNVATVTITINEGGAIQFSSAAYSVAENGGNATINVTRTGGNAGTATVQFTTSNGTAGSADYTSVTQTVTFVDGDTTETVNVPVTNDTLDEADETVNLTLSNAGGAGMLGTPNTAVLTITDDDAQPAITINDVSVTEGDSGTTNAVFTVTLSAASSLTVTANYATADGTASAPADYLSASGTVTFNPGQTTHNVTVNVNGDIASEANETFFVNLSGATNATIGDNQGVGTISDDDAAGGVIRFSAPAYTVQEDATGIEINVERAGTTTAAVTVDYSTGDISASQRSDYTTALGTLSFAAGETEKTIVILILEDSHVEGTETLSIELSNATGGAVIGSPAPATLEIADDVPETTGNPIDDAETFVRQHYHDFLNREPDADGLAFWTNQITECDSLPEPQREGCREVRRINVSAAFFLSIEFKQTGCLVYHFYTVALDRPNGLPRYLEFLRDTQRMQRGVVVNVGDWQAQLEANKQAFAEEFVTRGEFVALYPTTMTPAQYVDALYAHAGLTPTAEQRQAAVDEFGGAATSADMAARAKALRLIAESDELHDRDVNIAFVLEQYFGYLRRNPDDAPDGDLDGYNFWLNKLNQFNGDFVRAEMVKAFIISGEYRGRFGQP